MYVYMYIQPSSSLESLSQKLRNFFYSLKSRDEGKKTATVFLYTRIFEETDPWNKIPAEALETYRKYNQEIRAMKLPEKLTELFNAKDCFIHSDCHWKSVFVKDGKAAVCILHL